MQEELEVPLQKNLLIFFKKNNFSTFRLKTGTPARIRGDSIDFSKCIVQEGDIEPVPFSFMTKKLNVEQTPCFITHTNNKTHKLINKVFISRLFIMAVYNQEGQDIVLQSKIKLRDLLIELDIKYFWNQKQKLGK